MGHDGLGRGEMVEWLDEVEEWVEIGEINYSRWYHAATTVKMDDEALNYCK